MFIGGAQKRADGSYSTTVLAADGSVLGHVGEGNRKDLRDAVSAAHKAAPGWGERAAHNRAQILYYIAENLSARRGEFASRLDAISGAEEEAGKGLKEVDDSISRLFHWAAFADKYGGSVQETTLKGVTMQTNEPVGVIGVVCPESSPLLAFCSLVGAAVVRGNAVVVVPSEAGALIATDLYQVLETSDLPGGVINIVTGEADCMAKTLAEHQVCPSVRPSVCLSVCLCLWCIFAFYLELLYSPLVSCHLSVYPCVCLFFVYPCAH